MFDFLGPEKFYPKQLAGGKGPAERGEMDVCDDGVVGRVDVAAVLVGKRVVFWMGWVFRIGRVLFRRTAIAELGSHMDSGG